MSFTPIAVLDNSYVVKQVEMLGGRILNTEVPANRPRCIIKAADSDAEIIKSANNIVRLKAGEYRYTAVVNGNTVFIDQLDKVFITAVRNLDNKLFATSPEMVIGTEVRIGAPVFSDVVFDKLTTDVFIDSRVSTDIDVLAKDSNDVEGRDIYIYSDKTMSLYQGIPCKNVKALKAYDFIYFTDKLTADLENEDDYVDADGLIGLQVSLIDGGRKDIHNVVFKDSVFAMYNEDVRLSSLGHAADFNALVCYILTGVEA